MKVKSRNDPVFRPSVQCYTNQPTDQPTTPTDSNTGRDLFQLMRMCWREEPEGRPTFSDINKYIKKLSGGK